MIVLRVKGTDDYVGNHENSFNFCKNASDAMSFKQLETAKAFIKNSFPKKLKGYDVEIVTLDEKEDMLETAKELIKKLDGITFEKKLCDSLKTYLINVVNVLSSEEKATAYLEKYNNALVDLRHYIEFNQIKGIDADKILNLQQTMLRKRRLCKDRISLAEEIKSAGIDNIVKIVEHLYKMDNRAYNPRYTE